MKRKIAPLVGIIMGSDSDWPTMEAAFLVCQEFAVPCEVRVVSAHRTPDDMARYAKPARSQSHNRRRRRRGASAGHGCQPHAAAGHWCAGGE